MKLIPIAFTVAFIAASVHAQSIDRDAQFKRLEAKYTRAPAFQEPPPILIDLLQSARAANPNVPPETWKAIEAECAETLVRSSASALGILLRRAYAQLTDAELEHLAALTEDPVLIKAEALAAAPEIQNKLLEITLAHVLSLPASAINEVLRKRGLQVPP
jgi:hypothetical protein